MKDANQIAAEVWKQAIDAANVTTYDSDEEAIAIIESAIEEATREKDDVLHQFSRANSDLNKQILQLNRERTAHCEHPMQPVTNCGRCRDTKFVNGKPCPDCRAGEQGLVQELNQKLDEVISQRDEARLKLESYQHHNTALQRELNSQSAHASEKGAREWLIRGGGGHEDGEDGLRASTWTADGLIRIMEEYGEDCYDSGYIKACREALASGQCSWGELRDLLHLPSTDDDKALVISEIKHLMEARARPTK